MLWRKNIFTVLPHARFGYPDPGISHIKRSSFTTYDCGLHWYIVVEEQVIWQLKVTETQQVELDLFPSHVFYASPSHLKRD
jgi:hypothetical protein